MVTGICNICGEYKELTEEHVPPKQAHNKSSFIKLPYEDFMEPDPDMSNPWLKKQGGVRFETLCGDCNHKAGGNYVRRFSDWCNAGRNILERTGGNPPLVYPMEIHPLPILKEIVMMFFATSGKDFRVTYPELVPFVMNPDQRCLPPKYQFYVAYYLSPRIRMGSETTKVMYNRDTYEMKGVSTYRDIAFAPFVYVMCVDSPPPDSRLTPVSHFADFGSKEAVKVWQRLHVLPPDWNLPED